MGALSVVNSSAAGAQPAEPPAKLPWSEAAEQSLLGALLTDNGCWADVQGLVAESSFFSQSHRLVFAAVRELLAAGSTADEVTVFEVLAARSQADDAGGLKYLHELRMCVPSARNAQRYAEIVASRAAERVLLAGLDEARAVAWDSAVPLAERMLRLAEVVRRVQVLQDSPGGAQVPLLPLAGLQAEAGAVRWLVKGRVPTDSLGMLFGGSGTFKTYLALDLALHVCHGLQWMGKRTRQGAVIYIAAEGGAGLWTRIKAWHDARGIAWEGAPLYVVPVALDLAADAWRVVEAAQAAGVTPELVVVDTLSQTFAGEENSASDMAAYLRTLGTRFRALWHCAVMLVHHSGHAETERPRGSSAIRANVDFLLGATRDGDAMAAEICCIKQKDGELFPDAMFSLKVQRLGEDEDGEEVTQLVAMHLDGPQAIHDAMAHEAKQGRGGANRLLLSLLQNGMREEELRKAFYEDCGLDKVDSKKKAYMRALSWAKRSKFMEIAQGTVIVSKAAGGGL